MDFTEIVIEFKSHPPITIVHNLGDHITNAIESWQARTDDFTAHSFCTYIDSKQAGLLALPKELFEQLQSGEIEWDDDGDEVDNDDFDRNENNEDEEIYLQDGKYYFLQPKKDRTLYCCEGKQEMEIHPINNFKSKLVFYAEAFMYADKEQADDHIFFMNWKDIEVVPYMIIDGKMIPTEAD